MPLRRLVFEAMTKPDLLSRGLLGPPGWSMVDCESDLKVGGAFLHRWRHADGKEMAMGRRVPRNSSPRAYRTYRDIRHGMRPTVGPAARDRRPYRGGGKTTLTLTVSYPSKEARDATIASGWNEGSPRATTTSKGSCPPSHDDGFWLDRADRGPAGEAA